MRRKAASISKYMRNQPTPSDRAKTVHNSHETIFGYVTNDDDEGRTTRDETNDLESIIAVPGSAEQDEQEFPRPLRPPEPPPPLPRRPCPGTIYTFAPAISNDTAHGGGFSIEGPTRSIQSIPWHGMTSSSIKTILDKWKERISQKPPPPAEPPPAPPWHHLDARPPKPSRTQKGTFVFGETRPQGSPPLPRPLPTTKGGTSGATFVFGARHPPAQQSTTAAHALPPTSLPSQDCKGENTRRSPMFWVGQTRPPQLKSTTGTSAMQKERLPQEPPPPAESPPGGILLQCHGARPKPRRSKLQN